MANSNQPESSPQFPIIPGYTIKREISSGGFGRVYEATEVALNRRVALKSLHSVDEIGETKHEAHRLFFEKEWKFIAQFSHPNIVRVHTVVQADDGRDFLVQEYFDTTLKDYLENHGRLSVGQAIDVAIQLCQALHEIDRKNIVHRDIKPGNTFLMLAEDGTIERAALGDFGIALIVDDQTAQSENQRHPFSPGYVSPEQRDGQSLDIRSDLYNVGLVLYEMLYGERHSKVPNLSPPSGSSLQFESAMSVVSRLLREKREERYFNPQEVIRELERARTGEKIVATPTPKVPGYIVKQQIGEGLYTRVFRAIRESDGIEVAIKELRLDDDLQSLDLLARQVQLRRFRKEIQIAQNVNHPNIVRVYDAILGDNGEYYLVEELYPAGSLRDLVERRGRLSPGDALLVIKDGARALAQLEDKDIVHRDIKPENTLVVLDEDNNLQCAVLADLGVAQDEMETVTFSSGAVEHPGTPAYMSPEQKGKEPLLTVQSDIYSLGLVWYEMLYGTRYVKNPGLFNWRYASSNAVIRKMLQPEPENRYGSATELLAALEKVDTHLWSYVAKRGSGAAVLVASIVVLFLLFSNSKLPPDPTPTPSPTDTIAEIPAVLPTPTSTKILAPTPTRTPSRSPTSSPTLTATPTATTTATPTSTPSPTPEVTILNDSGSVIVRAGCGDVFPEIQEISDANSIKLIALGSHGSLDCYQVEFVVAGEVQTGWVSTVDVNPTSERDLDEETLPSMAINDGSDNNRLSVNEDSQLEIDIFENDYGPLNRGSLSISSSPSNGTLQENSESGIITYVPDANYYGNDQFRYQVQGENGESSSATVYISVEPVNDAPIITNDGASFTVAENSNSVRDFIVNATDADGDELTFTIVDGNTNNAFSINESNGQIQVNNPSALDYEEIRKFDLKIIVSDGEASTEGDLSILVENLVETVLVTIHFDSVFLSFDHQFDYAKFKFDVDIGNLNLFDSLRSFPQNGAANNGTIYWERFQTKYFDDYNNEDYNTYSYSLKEDQVFFIHGHGYLSTRDFSPLFIGSFWKGYALSDLVSGTYDETIEITCNELSTCESDSANYIIKYTITVDWQ